MMPFFHLRQQTANPLPRGGWQVPSTGAMRIGLGLLAWAALPLFGYGAKAQAAAAGSADAPPPGVVIDRSPDPKVSWIGSPSIVILPDGHYVASHDFFGKESPVGRQTWVFGSADRGLTWTPLAKMKNQTWSTLFVHRGALYLIGVEKEYGDILLRRSGDGGHTWTNPVDEKSGRLFRGTYHCGPTPVIVHDGRLWRAFEEYIGPDGSWSGRYFKSLVASVPEDADLLDASNWTKSNALAFDPQWIPGDRTGWLEGNVVPAPDGGLVNLLRVNAPIGPDADYALPGGAAGIPRYEVAARVGIAPDGRTVSFDPLRGFFRFPGSQSKFTIRYDSVSHRYWSLAQKITHPHDGRDRKNAPGLQRNVVMLVSSDDLVRWTEHGAVLRWKEGRILTTADRVAFQYVDWQFDGDDLIAVARTAWGDAASYHNANHLTFHRVKNFRDYAPADAPPDLAGVAGSTP